MTMLQLLFSSRVRSKLLVKFFVSPGIGFNAREIALDLNENYSAVWKELVRLEKIGILKSEKRGASIVYSIDPGCPIGSELRSIVLKTDGIDSSIRTRLLSLKEIKAAFIYGSFASGEADERSDLDLIVIGDVDLTTFSPIIALMESDLNRPVNYAIFSEHEWKSRLETGEPFVTNIVHAPKVMLVGEVKDV
jgi:predicted nucleotidyltransferase